MFGPKNNPIVKAQIAREARVAVIARLKDKRRKRLEKQVEEEEAQDFHSCDEEQANEVAAAKDDQMVAHFDEENNVNQTKNFDLYQDSQMPCSPSEIGCSLSETYLLPWHQDSDAWIAFYSDSPMFMYSIAPQDAALGLNHRQGMHLPEKPVGSRRSQRMRSMNSLYNEDYVK